MGAFQGNLHGSAKDQIKISILRDRGFGKSSNFLHVNFVLTGTLTLRSDKELTPMLLPHKVHVAISN